MAVEISTTINSFNLFKYTFFLYISLHMTFEVPYGESCPNGIVKKKCRECPYLIGAYRTFCTCKAKESGKRKNP